jgi:outer membrane protein assembly factor BamE (lipoprotein component of BamABCDE complex)
MNLKILVLLFVSIIGISIAGCSSNPSHSESIATGDVENNPPADSVLIKIKKGMSADDVLSILGPPTSSNNYQTGKGWLPFYYGPDTSRSDFIYSGRGRVVFSHNRYSGELKVIRITYDPEL